MVYEKKNRSLVFRGSRKIPTLWSTIQWETRQASFPSETVGPRVGIFLSPLNTNDGFYLSHIPVPARGKDKNEQTHVDLWHHCYFKLCHHVTSQRSLFHLCFSNIKWGIKWWARKRIHYLCKGGIENLSLLITVLWCKLVILWMDFSILSSHSWWILILSNG